MLNNLVCIDYDICKRSTVRNTRVSSLKVNKCHIIWKRDGYFLVIVLLMRGIRFPIILLLLQLYPALSTDYQTSFYVVVLFYLLF